MYDSQYHVALSHALLAGTGIYGLVQIKDTDLICPHVTYGLFVANNVVGALWWLTEFDSRLQNIFRVTSFCQMVFALPCMTTSVWLKHGYEKEWSWAWTVASLIPFILFVINSDKDAALVDILILLNLVGLGCVSVIKKNNYGIAATIAYGLAHLGVRRLDPRHMPLYNYGLCFFAYFALRAIGYGEDIL